MANRIDEAAAAWGVKAERGLDAREQDALDAWLAADDRHLGAFVRMRALMAHTERARALDGRLPSAAPEMADEPTITRRRLLGSAAVAAAIAGGLILRSGRAEAYTTGRGEVRVVALADGSVVTLNTSSKLNVRFTTARRTIELLEGEALFDVAKDAARPFIVDAGAMAVRAIGTSFTVSRFAGRPPAVLVREGLVEATTTGSQTGDPVRLVANMKATVASVSLAVVHLTPDATERELGWREGRLVFEGEALADAAGEFARYSDVRIVIADPALAAKEVSGSYEANDPVGFGKAAAEAFGASAEIGEGEIVLRRRATMGNSTGNR